MKKKNYTILTSGKFHYFEIAKILYERKQLSKIVSGYPWVKLKNELIPKKFIDSSGYFQIMTYFLHKIPKVNLDKLIDSIDYLNKQKIDYRGSKYLDITDVLISSAQSGVNTGKKIKEKSKIYICDQCSANIFFEDNLVNDEFKSLNISREKEFHQGMKDRALEEYNNSNYIMVPSNYVKKTFDKKYHSKIFVNNFGIDTKKFYPLPKENLNNEFFNIVYIGAISIRKGVHYLIDAFNKLKYSKKKLHLIGSHMQADIEFFKRKLNQENIINYGHVPNIQLNSILNKCDVFATATLSEGFAMVINQAIASGCPVIVTENSGAKEYVEQNNCGFVVPIRNSQIISDKLTLLLDDKNLLKKFSINSKNSGNLNTWNNYVDRLDAFLDI